MGTLIADSIDPQRVKNAEACLLDNGIAPDAVQTVLQALGYILLDTGLYPEEQTEPSKSANTENPEKKKPLKVFTLEEIGSYPHDPLRSEVHIFTSEEEAKKALLANMHTVWQDLSESHPFYAGNTVTKDCGTSIGYHITDGGRFGIISDGDRSDEMTIHEFRIRQHEIPSGRNREK